MSNILFSKILTGKMTNKNNKAKNNNGSDDSPTSSDFGDYETMSDASSLTEEKKPSRSSKCNKRVIAEEKEKGQNRVC